jgi:hypothetical protein
MKTLTLLAVIACAMAPALSSAEFVWSVGDKPSGTPVSTPDKVKLDGWVTFTVQHPLDLDKLTTITSGNGCISSTFETVPENEDHLGGVWDIVQPGVEGLTKKNGISASVQALAWTWSSHNGDTGSVVNVGGLFTFDDGRPTTDPRHDTVGCALGAATSMLLIPDRVATTLYQHLYSGYVHVGVDFNEKVTNQAWPDFSFGQLFPNDPSGYEVVEEIVWVGFDQVEDDEVRDEIMAWSGRSLMLPADNTIGDKNQLDPSRFRYGNTYISAIQVFKINNHGWPAKNPDHRIGMASTFWSGIHTIVMHLKDPPYVEVTKSDWH